MRSLLVFISLASGASVCFGQVRDALEIVELKVSAGVDKDEVRRKIERNEKQIHRCHQIHKPMGDGVVALTTKIVARGLETNLQSSFTKNQRFNECVLNHVRSLLLFPKPQVGQSIDISLDFVIAPLKLNQQPSGIPDMTNPGQTLKSENPPKT